MPHMEIKFTDIIFDPKVQSYCNNPQFQCPNYGHSWACPPEAPYLENKISEYDQFFLVYSEFDIQAHIKEVQNTHPKRSASRILRSLYRKNMGRDLLEKEIENFLSQEDRNYQKRFILWDGHCRVCYQKEGNPCSYDEGILCRYPEEIRYSMEAVGIDVNATVKNGGITLEWPPQQYLYRFGLICYKV